LNTKSHSARLSDTLRQRIVFDGTSTPVKTALFIIICLAWTLPGLVGHDPWKPEEAIAFGAIHNLLTDGGWLVPGIAGVPYLEQPPLFIWAGALFASLLSPLFSQHDAARLASGLFMSVAMLFTALAAIRLIDVRAGRISVLILIGSLGLLLRAHEITPQLAPFAGMSIVLYGLVRLRDAPWKGGIWLGAGMGLFALGGGAAPALLPVVVPLALGAMKRDWLKKETLKALALALAIAVPCALIWPVLLLLHTDLPVSSWLSAATGFRVLEGGRSFEPYYFARILPWYALPALPAALWAWWRARKQLRERYEQAMPLATFLILLAGYSFMREARDDMALPLLLPLALAAAQSIDRLPRGLASFVDWFGTVTFFLLAALLWTGWSAAHTGVPEDAAQWVLRQAPDLVHRINWPLFLLASALTLLWLLAAFRTRRSNRRAIVNWTSGITLVWMLGNLLWLPAIDHVRSYRETAKTLKAALPAHPACIAQSGLGDAQRAAFDYHAGLRFLDTRQSAQIPCDVLLVQSARGSEPQAGNGWVLLWQGARPGDKKELFSLYHKHG
jgi:4-amino-4-deoxy-L-arabinose transferase-like glycosyltransferase